MKYSVFTVSTPEFSPDELVQKLRAFGYDGVEWRVIDQVKTDGSGFWNGNRATIPFSTFEQDAPRVRQITEDAGLGISGVGTYVRCENLEGVNAAIRGVKALGANRFRVTVPSYDGRAPFLPIWETARAQYRDVVALAATHNMKVLLELHHRSITPTASAARIFLDDLDPKHVGVIHDAGNMVFEGFEAYRLGLEMLGPYLAHVHVKNARWFPISNRPDGSLEWSCGWTGVHRGIANIADLFRALRDVGYDGWVAVEDFSIDRPIEDRLRENLTYLKNVEAAIADEAENRAEP